MSTTETLEYPDKIDGAVLKVAGVVVLGAIMSILDITVVSVALETFQREFDATAAEVAWTMTGYTLALASVIPLTDPHGLRVALVQSEHANARPFTPWEHSTVPADKQIRGLETARLRDAANALASSS